jgi:hypothetical protein
LATSAACADVKWIVKASIGSLPKIGAANSGTATISGQSLQWKAVYRHPSCFLSHASVRGENGLKYPELSFRPLRPDPLFLQLLTLNVRHSQDFFERVALDPAARGIVAWLK